MVGIVIQLLLSWILLWAIERKDLTVLGFRPTKRRLQQFSAGLILPIIYFVLIFIALAQFGKNPYHRNENYTWSEFLEAIWYLFKAISFETLIFDGALLYILIKRIGAIKATFCSAVAFGIYHWFSWELFGQPAAMAVAFLTTGLAGYLWALAYVKTKSIYLPFGLHFGVDFVFSIVFSKDKSIGQQLFVQAYSTDPYSPGPVISIVMMLLYFLGLPALTFLYLKSLKDTTKDVMGVVV